MRSLFLLALIGGAAAQQKPTWVDPPAEYVGICHKMTGVFDAVKVCLTERAYGTAGSDREKEYNYVVNVVAQVLDNNENGIVDDAQVQKRLRDDNSVLYVDARCQDHAYVENPVDLLNNAKTAKKPLGRYQLVCLEDVHPKSCDIPEERGAAQAPTTTAARKAAWEPVRKTTTGCTRQRDQTFEKVLTLVAKAASHVYADRWSVFNNTASTLQAHLLEANDDCGFGFSKDYKDPHSDHCHGYFSVYDPMCRPCDGCVMAKGLYFALATYLGALYTEIRFEDVKSDWTLTVPDNGMREAGAGSYTLEDKAKGLWDFVRGTANNAQDGWVPSRLPNGKYSRTLTSGTSLSDMVAVKPAKWEDVNDEKECPPPPPPPSDDDSNTATIVIVVIVVIIVLALLVLCVYACCKGKDLHAKNEPTA